MFRNPRSYAFFPSLPCARSSVCFSMQNYTILLHLHFPPLSSSALCFSLSVCLCLYRFILPLSPSPGRLERTSVVLSAKVPVLKINP